MTPAAMPRISVLLTSLFWLLILPCASAQSAAFDIVITHGRIIDGTGSPWYSGDLGIRGGKIAEIGNLAAAARARTIDAHGQVVAPGFIDMLGQSELTILVDPRLPSKIYQGITTEITGETTRSAVRARDNSICLAFNRTGKRSANTSRDSKSKASASTSPITLALPRSVAWCSEMTTSSLRPRNLTG